MIFLSLAGLILSLVFFRVGVIEIHKKHVHKTVLSDTKVSLNYANHLINEMVADLEGISKVVVNFDDLKNTETLKLLRYATETSSFSFIGVADDKGNAYDNEENVIDISERKYFKEAMSGRVSFSELIESKVYPNEKVQVISHPIRTKNNNIRGIVYGIIHLSNVDKLTIQNDANDQANVYIVDSNGDYIAQFRENNILPTQGNFWKDMKKTSMTNEEEIKMKNDFKKRNEGSLEYSYGPEEKNRYVCYMPIGPNKWQLVYSVSLDNMDNLVKDIYSLDYKETVFVFIFHILFLMAIIIYYKQLNHRNEESKQAAIKNMKYMQFAVDTSGHIIFEYDCNKKTINLKCSNRNLLLNKSEITDVPENIISKNIIASDIIENFSMIFETIKTNESAVEEIHVLDNNEDIWYKIMMHNIYSDKNKDFVTMGVMEEITEEKKKEIKLQKKIQIQKTLAFNSLMYGVIDLKRGIVLEWKENNKEDEIEKKEVNLSYNSTIQNKILNLVDNEYKFSLSEVLSLKNLRKEYDKGKESGEIQYLRNFENEKRWTSLRIYRMYGAYESKAIIIVTDIDKQKRKELLFKNRAERDGLTGLYNAITARDKINKELCENQKMGEQHIFVLIDLDNYKQINDTFGHNYGDKVLIDIANILNNRFRSTDIVCRLGGDEFVIFLKNIRSYEYAEQLIGELCEIINKTYRKGNKEVVISASIGIAIAPKDGNDFQELYKKADMAQYDVKKIQKMDLNGIKNVK